MYASLRQAGQLKKMAQERAELFAEEVHRATAEAIMERSRKNMGFEDGLQREEQAIRVAVEVGLANATDFPADEKQDYQTE